MRTFTIVRLAGTGTLVINLVYLGHDIRCHMVNPDCDYSYEGIGITSTASDSGMTYQQPAVVSRST